MKIAHLFFISLTLTLLAGTGYAESESDREAFVLCRNRKIVRTIRVEKNEQNFHTIYTKAGVDKTVGEAQWYEHAFGIMKNIRKNLEGAGWTCLDVENFEVKRSTSGQ